MDDKNITRLSKTLALMLRHRPEHFGLELGADGWVALADVLAALHATQRWQTVTRGDIEAILARPGKKRYEIDDDRIRAMYGHSTEVEVTDTPAQPPDVLYHGTTPQAADAILRKGLKSMRRQYVHLSADLDTARVVALRRTSTPVIFAIDAARAHADGIPFYAVNDDVWLAPAIAQEYLTRSEG